MSRSTTFSAERKEAPADEAKICLPQKMQTIARAPHKNGYCVPNYFLISHTIFFYALDKIHTINPVVGSQSNANDIAAIAFSNLREKMWREPNSSLNKIAFS